MIVEGKVDEDKILKHKIIQRYWLEEENSLESMEEIITRMNRFYTKVDILQSEKKKRQLGDSYQAEMMLGRDKYF